MRAGKLAVLESFKRTGIFSLVRRSPWRRHRLLILCYHGISLRDEHAWNPELYMPAELLRSRLEFLRRNGYPILPLGEGLRRLRDGGLEEPSVALTFDDGNYDFYSRAWPILREYDAPATVYVSTYYSAFNRPVFDPAVPYLLWRGSGRRWNASRCTGIDRTFELDSPAHRAEASACLREYVRERNMSGPEKDDFLARLSGEIGVDYGEILSLRLLHLMKPEEVAEVAADGADVQLHTHRHRTPRERGLFTREIEENRLFLEKLTARPVEHFCYPSGDYDPRFLPWLRELGVASAATCRAGLAAGAADPLVLPRLVDTCHMTWLLLEGWLTGAAAILPRRS